MGSEYLGHAVENGRVRFFSVSSVEKADPQSNGCYRRWANRYVFGFKEDESEKNAEAKQFGIDGHDRIKQYLQTGEMVLGTCESRGKHFIPKPGPDLWVEQKFHRVEGANITSNLHAADVPFTGFIDLGHRRPIVLGLPEFEPPDPPGTFEVNDWKFKGTDKDRNGVPTYKHRDELVHTVQMAGYGVLVGNTQPDVEHIRLSHTYFFKKPSANPRKVTKLHVIDDCRRTWEYVESVCRTMKDVAREQDIERVPGNIRACDTWGGCPYATARLDENGRVIRPACSAYQKNSLDVLYGNAVRNWNNPATPNVVAQQGAIDMGILSQVQAPQATQAPQQNNFMQQLAEEEAKQRAAQAQIQTQATQPTLADVWAGIMKHGRGVPSLAGNAAVEVARAFGQSVVLGFTQQGSGQLGGLTLTEIAHVYQLAGELAGAQPTAPAPQAAPQQAYNTMQVGGALPPDAPQSMPQLAQAHAPAAPQQAPAVGVPNNPIPQQQDVPLTQPPAEAATKAKRGRPKKDDSTPTQEVVATQPQQTPTPSSLQSSAPQAAPASGPIYTETKAPAVDGAVFVDCLPNGPFTDLHAYVAGINAEIAKRYCVGQDGKPSVQDIRCAPKHVEILAFGNWKGLIRDVVINNPPPKGALFLDTRYSEIAEVVADALRDFCDARGVLYVRGVR